MMLLVGTILWLEVRIKLTQCFPCFASIPILFKFSKYPMPSIWIGTSHHLNVSIMRYLDIGLTHTISLTTLLCRLSFLLHNPRCLSTFVESATVQVHPIRSSECYFSKDST